MGIAAPRVASIMCRSRLVSPESKDLTGTAMRKSHAAGVANAFAARGVADAVDLVHGMRHVVAERGLIGNPCGVRLRESKMRHKKSQRKQTSRRARKFRFIVSPRI